MRLWALALVLLLTACADAPAAPLEPLDDIDLPEAGTFTVTVSGAADAAFSGTGQAVVSENGRAVYLAGERYSANLVLPRDQVAGTFVVIPLLNAFDVRQNVHLIGGVLVDSETPDASAEAEPLLPVHLYDNVLEGRATLHSIEPMTGAYVFTAADADGRVVTVRAAFNALPVATETP